jgi:hypothetical protein
MNESGKWCESESIDLEGDHRLIELLFGISATAFVEEHLGHTVAVHHGHVGRLIPLLKNIRLTEPDAIRHFAVDYSQPVRVAVTTPEGILGYAALNREGRGQIVETTGRWYIFDRLEAHFKAARDTVQQLCHGLGYPRLGATCTGFFHTPGARVPRHCDELDVVIMQIFGRRDWCVEPNSHPPVGVWDPVQVPEDGGRWDTGFGASCRMIQLFPGSVLYLPGAWWHETRSSDFSFSLTFGLPGATADPIRRPRSE